MSISRESPGRDDLVRSAVPLTALLLAVVPLVLSWFTREYTHDDFYHAYLGWLRSTDLRPGQDYFVPNFTFLAEIAAPLFGALRDSFAPLDLLRGAMLGVALSLLLVTFEAGRRLSGSVAWGAASAAVLAWHPQIILRISDIRTDQIAAVLFLLALVLLLAAKPYPLLIGLISGLAAVFSQKMLVAIPFIGLAVLVANRGTLVRATVRFAAGLALFPVAHFGYRIAFDGWNGFLAVFRSVASAVGAAPPGSRRAFLAAIASPVPALAMLVLAGGVALLASPSDRRNRIGYLALAVGFLATFVALNPYLYVYNALLFVPLLAPLLAGIHPFLRQRGWMMVDTAALALVALLAVTGGLGAMAVALSGSSGEQRNTLEWMWESTAPDEAVFDWQGMHYGRPGIFHWWIFTAMTPSYQSGDWYTLRDELRSADVRLILVNYRLGWMTPEDARFVRTNFVPLGQCALVPGRVIGGADLRDGAEFEVFAPGIYETAPSGSRVLIDGAPAGPLVRLGRGLHTVRVEEGDPPAAFGIRYRGARRRRLPPCGSEPLLAGFNVLPAPP